MKQSDAVFVPNALQLTEEAVHLLRRSRLKVLTDYYMGSLPFILGLLYFWSDMSRSAYASRYCSPAAAGLALLFIWMKYCHVRFCRGLWHTLQDTKPEKPKFRDELAVMARQTMIHASGIIIQPLSMILLMPLAWTYAFYQNATVMEHPRSKNFRSLCQHAAKHALEWPGQNHLILCIVPLFAAIIFCNLAVAIMVLPYVCKKVLGMETLFTISGLHAMTNTTFLAIVCALTYLCVDPILKAVYTLRCFYSASRYSGDDIAIRLKPYLKAHLKTGALVLWLCLGCFSPIGIAMADASETAYRMPTAEEIAAEGENLNRSIETVLQKPQFAWRLPGKKMEKEGKEEDGWLQSAAKWLVEKLEDAFRGMEKWLDALVEWLKNAFPKMDLSPGKTKSVDTLIRVMFGVISLLGILLIGAVCRRYIKSSALKKNRFSGPETVHGKIDVTDETLIADDLPYDRWLSMAGDCMASKDFRPALRALYLAILCQLGDTHRIVIARFKSNQDYLDELSFHVHVEPELVNLFQGAMILFEHFWYGMYPVTREAMIGFKSLQERIAVLVDQQH